MNVHRCYNIKILIPQRSANIKISKHITSLRQRLIPENYGKRGKCTNIRKRIIGEIAQAIYNQVIGFIICNRNSGRQIRALKLLRIMQVFSKRDRKSSSRFDIYIFAEVVQRIIKPTDCIISPRNSKSDFNTVPVFYNSLVANSVYSKHNLNGIDLYRISHGIERIGLKSILPFRKYILCKPAKGCEK